MATKFDDRIGSADTPTRATDSRSLDDLEPLDRGRLGDHDRAHWLASRALVEVGDDVLDRLDAHRDADHVVADPHRVPLGVRHLLMGGRGGVDHQRLGVADVGQVGGQLDTVDELDPGVVPALDPEGEHRAGAGGQVLLRQRRPRVVVEDRIADPLDTGVLARGTAATVAAFST